MNCIERDDYESHDPINPTGAVPVGLELGLDVQYGRPTLKGRS